MSDTPLLPDFDDVANLFLRLGALESPSALHGYLLGQLVMGAALSEEEWLTQALEYLDGIAAEGEDGSLLVEMLQVTRKQLAGELFSMQLLLPDDNSELAARVESLAEWCQGFLAGFAMAGGQPDRLKEDSKDALGDVLAIAQVGFDDEDGQDEAGEQAFFEVSDHTRMAVITLYAEQKGSSVEELAKKVEQELASSTLSPTSLFGGKKTLH